jgi:hypothetical protein
MQFNLFYPEMLNRNTLKAPANQFDSFQEAMKDMVGRRPELLPQEAGLQDSNILAENDTHMLIIGRYRLLSRRLWQNSSFLGVSWILHTRF